ncbi:MAG: hypothetical protein WD070_06675, partial [Pirellulaceae bacterium]
LSGLFNSERGFGTLLFFNQPGELRTQLLDLRLLRSLSSWLRLVAGWRRGHDLDDIDLATLQFLDAFRQVIEEINDLRRRYLANVNG